MSLTRTPTSWSSTFRILGLYLAGASAALAQADDLEARAVPMAPPSFSAWLEGSPDEPMSGPALDAGTEDGVAMPPGGGPPESLPDLDDGNSIVRMLGDPGTQQSMIGEAAIENPLQVEF